MLIKKNLVRLLISCLIATQFLPALAEPTPPFPSHTTRAKQPNNVFSIKDYGAKKGSKKDSTPAILSALAAANKYVKKHNKPAEIFIPSGTYVFSQVELELNQVNIHFGPDVELNALAKNPSIHLLEPLISIKGKDFSIYGESNVILNGNGNSWSESEEKPNFINVTNSSQFELYGFTIIDSPNHALHLSECENGKIHDLDITSIEGTNHGNGLVINSSTGPTHTLHIHDCSLDGGEGLVIGSTLNHDITEVLVENIAFTKTQNAIAIIFSYSETAANLENIKFDTITAKDITKDAVFITTRYGEKRNRIGTLQNIRFTNFICDGAQRALNITLSRRVQALTPLLFDNVSFTGTQEENIVKRCPLIFEENPQKAVM